MTDGAPSCSTEVYRKLGQLLLKTTLKNNLTNWEQNMKKWEDLHSNANQCYLIMLTLLKKVQHDI